jgi:predicted nucleic acid-binding protein
MGTEYLLDSNTVIGFLARKLPGPGMTALSAIVDRTPRISVIVQIEVLRFNDSPENEQMLAEFVDSSIVYRLTDELVRDTITLCKGHKIKLPDAIIAATALREGFTLVTRNVDDFKNVPGLNILNPWSITV